MSVLVVRWCAGRRLAFLSGLATAVVVVVSACNPPAQTSALSGLPSTVPGSPSSAVDLPLSTGGTSTPAAIASPRGDGVPNSTAAPLDASEGVKIGQRALDFSLPTLEGGRMRLSDLRGRTVLINFWATWCPPCREEMPALNDLFQKRRDQGFVVVAVNFGEDLQTVKAFVDEGTYAFPVLLDRDGDVAFAYQAVALPTSYLIDSSGIVRDRVVGEMTPEIMQAKMQRLVGADTQSLPGPSSGEASGSANEQVVAALGEERITMREVNHRLDVLLALDRLESGAVLDPLRAADQAELQQRRRYALDDLIDGRLLADAARVANLKPDIAAVEHALVTLATEAGGSDPLAAELAKHGVDVGDVRSLLEEGYLSGTYVQQLIAAGADDDSARDQVRRWLDAERSRREVRILQKLE